jgi:hypothetical protein
LPNPSPKLAQPRLSGLAPNPFCGPPVSLKESVFSANHLFCRFIRAKILYASTVLANTTGGFAAAGRRL